MQPAAENYNFLDKQLAQLFLRMCANAGCTLDETQKSDLTELAQLAGASTRNGVIAVPLTTLEADIDLSQLESLPVLGKPGDYAPLIVEGEYVWLNRYWHYETRLANSLAQRLSPIPLDDHKAETIRHQLQSWFPAAGRQQEPDWQQRAIALAACSRFMIISGGPGTGKTTTVTRLLALLTGIMQVDPQRILLAAPTGKAAMRLQESISHAKNNSGIAETIAEQIPEQASTLHRLLGYIPGKVGFRNNLQNPLAADVVIVDEASMIDISLMTHLFEAVPETAQLILLGDKDQLASVETGSIFRDLCASANNQYTPTRQQQVVRLTQTQVSPLTDNPSESTNVETQADRPNALNDHIVVLQKSWRFATDSGIGQLSAAVRNGKEDELSRLLNASWPDISRDESGSLTMEDLVGHWRGYFSMVNENSGYSQPDNARLHELFAAFNSFRILSPLRKGPSGTEHINQLINQHLGKQQGGTRQSPWFAGRPVMVMQNDYRQNLFNGDIGLTLRDNTGQLRVWFPEHEGFRAIAPVRLPAHETAWAMTIHKSQGSEFDEVLLILPEDEDSRVLGRELLYTGITRARQLIHISGKLSVLKRALRQTMPPSSCIRQRLFDYERYGRTASYLNAPHTDPDVWPYHQAIL